MMSQDLVNPANDRTYAQFKLSAAVADFPAMLGMEERQLPAYLATLASKVPGKFVELGCYLGGSTACLLDGLRQSGGLAGDQPLIDSYDLFIANEYMVEHSLKSYGVENGQSFEPVFVALLGKDAPWVRAHAGDIRAETWAEPISLLYVDILWSWDVNQHVIQTFYRHLSAGSWLIHQDFIYSLYPWLPVSMEYFVQAGFFSYQHFAEHGTVSFRCEKALDEAALAIDFQQMTYEEKRSLLQQASERFVGYPQALLELAIAPCMVQQGLKDEAFHHIAKVQSQHDHPFAAHHVAMVEGWVRGQSVIGT
jgi:hypothetical protein